MPSKAEFAKVCKELKTSGGQPVTFEQVGRVFGSDFYQQLIYALMDAQLAARAIHGAIERLRAGEPVVEEEEGE